MPNEYLINSTMHYPNDYPHHMT